jgi:hypothetical protein
MENDALFPEFPRIIIDKTIQRIQRGTRLAVPDVNNGRTDEMNRAFKVSPGNSLGGYTTSMTKWNRCDI